MAISDTYAFNPDVGEIVEEAYERAGLEMRSGYDLRTARRSLNIMTLEWQNRGINLWTVEEVTYDSNGDGTGTETLIKGTSSYNLALGTIGVLDVILRTDAGDATNQTDYQLNRIAEPTYATIPNKLTQARPLQYYIQRKEILDTGSSTNQNDTLNLWPVPDESSKYKILYWRMKRIADTGTGSANTMQVPGRFIPALVSGLAYQVAMKKGADFQKVSALKDIYEEQFMLAAEEDREKAPVRFTPGGYQY